MRVSDYTCNLGHVSAVHLSRVDGHGDELPAGTRRVRVGADGVVLERMVGDLNKLRVKNI